MHYTKIFLHKTTILESALIWNYILSSYVPQLNAKYKKNELANPEKSAVFNGTHKPGHFGSFWPTFRQVRIFPQNSALSVLSTYDPSTSCKI